MDVVVVLFTCPKCGQTFSQAVFGIDPNSIVFRCDCGTVVEADTDDPTV